MAFFQKKSKVLSSLFSSSENVLKKSEGIWQEKVLEKFYKNHENRVKKPLFIFQEKSIFLIQKNPLGEKKAIDQSRNFIFSKIFGLTLEFLLFAISIVFF